MNDIQWFIDFLDAKTYLEIGVRNGESFLPIRCQNKIGVDICFPVKPLDGILYEMTSDEYFRCCPSYFDVAYIDGDHTYKQSLKDVLNCLEWMNPNGVILMHDCNPTQREWATPTWVQASPDWCGEVWKTVLTLRNRPDLFVAVLDVKYGMGIIMRGEQTPLPYSEEQIEKMTYKDLEENREIFFPFLKSHG